MSTFTKQILSGSTNGRNILVVPTVTPGTIIHTAVSGTTNFDEIWLWVTNTSATISNVKVTIEFGGVTDPADHIEVYLPAESGLRLAVPGLILQNGVVIRAFASSANIITISGFVNRITV